MRLNLLIIFLFTFTITFAQKGKKYSNQEYIDMYKDIAMEEMKRTGIPASITLAQGILESGSGNSTLATKANNHFGIKCHDWDGPTVRHDDDKKNECFRKYKNAEYSYRDHSDFLTSKSRYSELFELKQDDYKGWAKGLKKAGYATSPTYAKALIDIIEKYNLSQYDKEVLSGKPSRWKNQSAIASDDVSTVGDRVIKYNNRVKYIVAKEGDTYEKISEELYLFSWQLPRYNDVQMNTPLKAGDYVYLQPKRNKIYGGHKTHKVKAGETLHSISQEYGIKEKKLRERNGLAEFAEPKAGVTLILRGKRKTPISQKNISVKKDNNKLIDKKNKEPRTNQNSEEEEEFEIEFEL